MSTILRILLIASIAALAVMWFRHPTRLRELGRKAQLVAFIWVLAIVIGAVLQVVGLRGY